MNPTPPPPYQIIPTEYLLADGVLPEDGVVHCLGWKENEWVDSVFTGRLLDEANREFVQQGYSFYASAQLDHECFRTPSGAQVTTEVATVEPASTEPSGCVAAGTSPEELAEVFWGASATQSTGDPAPEPQYRMLEVGEVIQEGDEYLSCNDQWLWTIRAGQKVEAISRRYRRPVDAGQASESTPAPCAAKLPESATLISRVREAIFQRDGLWPIFSQLADLAEQQQARIAELEKERDSAVNERRACHELYDRILTLCGFDPSKGHPGIVDSVEYALSAERQKREAAEKRLALWEAFPGHLIDHHEGDTITEEGLQFALSDLINRNPQFKEFDGSTEESEISNLEAELSTIRAENAELRKDKKRLDWLETTTKESYTGISFDWCRHAEEGQVVEHGFRFMRHHFLGDRKKGIRAAIDSAKAKGEEQ